MGAVYSLLKIISNKEKKNYCKISSRFPNDVLEGPAFIVQFFTTSAHDFACHFYMIRYIFPSYVTVIVLSIVHSAVVVVQSLSHVQLFVTPWTAAYHASLSFTSPRVCSNSCPLSWWCYLTISPSAAPFSLCLPSFPASRSFPINGLFPSHDQSIWASA